MALNSSDDDDAAPRTEGAPTTTPRPFPAFVPQDGRFLGSTGRWWLELRIDTGGSGLISMDVHTAGPQGRFMEASACTVAPMDAGAGRWPVRWTMRGGHAAEGWLALRPTPDAAGAYTVYARLDGSLDGLGPLTIAARVARVGETVRELGLEIEVERGVLPGATVYLDDEPLDLEECLRRAGFAVHPVGRSDSVAAPAGGSWHGVDLLDQLNLTMTRSAQASLDVPAMEAHLLLLSTSDREGLCGVMFDIGGDFPRQGAAVFVETIRSRFRDDGGSDPMILRTVLHEMGHVLNLAHRYSVGYWNSLSPMNNPWCFRGGRREREYFNAFRFAFDADELAFLRHGRRTALLPGGEPFGADPYWHTGDQKNAQSGVDPGNLRLWLTPPGRGQGETVTMWGLPLFLEVSLRNVDRQPVVVPRHALDVKAGLLDILVEERSGEANGWGEERPFVPVMRRCYDVTDDQLVRLECGQSVHDNVNLGLTSDGPVFPRPGRYRIVPRLRLPGSRSAGPEILEVRGTPLIVDVRAPKDAATERHAEALLRTPLSLALAMGGAGGRTDVAAELTEIADRRVREHGDPQADPFAAVLERMAGISAGRSNPNPDAALRLERAAANEEAFDPHTREHTRRLAARLRTSDAEPQWTEPPRVVVDLAVHDANGTHVAPSAAGVLRVDCDGRGWAVMAPAHVLPPAALEADSAVTADVTVANPSDGLTERMSASRVDLLGRDDGREPTLAMLWLPRPVPGGCPSPTFPPGRSERRRADETLWECLQRSRLTPANLGDQMGDAVRPWKHAAEGALATGPQDALPVQAESTGRRLRHPDLDDVSDWICSWAWWCDCAGPAGSNPPGGPGAPYPFPQHYPYDSPDRGGYGATTTNPGEAPTEGSSPAKAS